MIHYTSQYLSPPPQQPQIRTSFLAAAPQPNQGDDNVIRPPAESVTYQVFLHLSMLGVFVAGQISTCILNHLFDHRVLLT
jgi:hypothetical protein